MSETPPELTTGERIQYHRERRGVSRPVLAGLVGRSAEWLKAVEKGRREIRSLPMLVRLAQALRLDDLAALTGVRTTLPVRDAGRLSHPSVPALRDVIHAGMFRQPQNLPESADVLQGRVRQAWTTWHSSPHQRTEVGSLLPELLLSAQQATRRTEGPERRRAYAVMAEVYALAQQFAAHITEPELYWIVVDRTRTACELADDPVLLAFSAWVTANGLRGGGHTEDALRLLAQAADGLRPRLDDGPDQLRATFGALCLGVAVTAAQEGSDGDAWRWHDEAARTARQLPDGYAHPWTSFGVGNVAVHAVTIEVDLHTPGAALRRAADTVPDSIPSLERRSRLFVDAARSEYARKEHAGSLHYLRQAFRTSPEAVRFVPTARRLAADLALNSPASLKDAARALADAVGVAA
ncbi:helix-turn-helix domain-containing protein [Streptomyces sp. NPDC058220]|uniref:helix-turn-helix domain-containing protein n=1 Tax=Streptomyces sp. NPDC058220 TaxID=3346387 RepID=UPI0036E7393F